MGMVIRKQLCTKCLVVCTKQAKASKKHDKIAMYLIVLVDWLVSPKMKLLVRKLLDEFPSKAPIREHKTSEIELREVEADKWPLRTDTANPLSLASSYIKSNKPKSSKNIN